MVKSANTENVNLNENKIEQISDSGCTNHVINDENFFNKAIDLKELINIKVGDGRILKAIKVGYVNSKFKTFNNNMTYIELNDVFYVKDMDRNLMSSAKVTDNYKVVSIGHRTCKGYNDLENEDLNKNFEKEKIENVNDKENKNVENSNKND